MNRIAITPVLLQSYTICSHHWHLFMLTCNHKLLFLHISSHCCTSISILPWFCLQQTACPFPQDPCLLCKPKSTTVNHHNLLSLLNRFAPLFHSLPLPPTIGTVLYALCLFLVNFELPLSLPVV